MSERPPKATLSTIKERKRDAIVVPIAAAPKATASKDEASAAAPVADETVARETKANATLHRAQAELIVERYTTYAALGGSIPIFILDTAAVSFSIIQMVRELAGHYRLPFAADCVIASLAAVIGGLVAPGIGGLAAQVLSRLTPGAWLFASAASSATAIAFTRITGRAFIEHFESGGTATDFDFARLRTQFGLGYAR